VAACVRERVARRYPIAVVCSGRDATRFSTGPKREVILCAGHFWDEGENVAPLIGAASRVPWPMLVDGGSDSRSPGPGGLRRLERLTSRRAARLYSRASIFVAVARQEAVGLSPLEAAFSGCALVLGDIPSLREIWDDAAMFVDPESSDTLVEALTTLIGNQTLRQNLARRALERAQQYGVDSTARGYLSLYRELTMPLTTAAAAL
jgi:glycosyltransferase involved in cell wall biosynthesis